MGVDRSRRGHPCRGTNAGGGLFRRPDWWQSGTGPSPRRDASRQPGVKRERHPGLSGERDKGPRRWSQRWVAVDGGARMRGGLASLRDAGVIRVDTGGVVALLLNHRLMSGNPPGSGRGDAVSRSMCLLNHWLQAAKPPAWGPRDCLQRQQTVGRNWIAQGQKKAATRRSPL